MLGNVFDLLLLVLIFGIKWPTFYFSFPGKRKKKGFWNWKKQAVKKFASSSLVASKLLQTTCACKCGIF